MRRFFLKGFLLFFCALILAGYQPVIGLFKLKGSYKFPNSGSVKLVKQGSDSKTLVIGCSNLQHAIDFKKIPQCDFLYFSASQRFTFLEYLVDIGLTKNYENIILCLPYNFLKKEEDVSVAVSSSYSFREVLCYDYIFNTIKRHPVTFFYDWTAIYDSVKVYRKTETPSSSFVTSSDPYMDSLNTNGTPYYTCHSKFYSQKHNVLIKELDEERVIKLFKPTQKIYIYYSPIANTSKNIASLQNIKNQLPHAINKPFTMDSSLFYDQWYHLNKCGSKLETDRFLQTINETVELK